MTPRRALALLAAFFVTMAVPLAAAEASIREPESSTPATSWTALAAADGVRVGVVVNDFLVVSNVIDAGGPAAQAVVDAFGDSRAYAAYPYPGDIVLTAHGLSQGAAPKYPLIAQSDPTQPTSDVTAGPYHLRANTADDMSSAVAESAAGGGEVAAGTTKSTASAAHAPATGAVTAVAETSIEDVSIAGVLSIGRVHSFAQMASAPGKPAQRTSDTEVGDITVGGQQVGLTDKGLVLVGTDVPLPPDSTANALLSAAGITVHYLAATTSSTSTVAPGLSVTVRQNVSGVGPTTVSYVFGQAAATAQATGAVANPPAPTANGTSALTSTGGASTPSAAAVAPPAAGVTAVPVAGGSGIPPSSQAPVTAGVPAPTVGYALAGASGISSASFYIVVAAGAIVMLAAAQLFRILAVRLAWT